MGCLLAGLAIFKASPVFAQIQVPRCTATVDDLDFGTIEAVDLAKTVDGLIRVSCRGEPSREVLICAGIGDGGSGTQAPEHLLRRLRTSDENTPLLYNLLRNNGTVWGSDLLSQQIAAPGVQTRLRLDAQGSGAVALSIIARIDDQAKVPPGVYRSEFSGDSALFLYRYPLGVDSELGDTCSNIFFRTFLPDPETSAQFMVSATVIDTPPGFTKAFSPPTIRQGGISTLTFTIDNSGKDIDVTDLAFTDSLLPGLVVADTPGAINSCGGMFDATGTTITLSGGRVAARATCEVAVAVRGVEIGGFTTITTDLTSSIATADGTRARLLVQANAPDFSKVFSPAMTGVGLFSRLIYTIDNSRNEVDVGSLAFIDDLPVALDVAPSPDVSTTCGGTFAFDPITGTSGVQFSGGRVAAGQTCTLSLNVRGLQFTGGEIMSVSGELTSDLAAPAPGASATLTITENPLSVSMEFSPARITPGGVSRLTYRLRNDTVIPAVQTFLLDVLPAGVLVAAQPNAETTCPNFNFIAGAGNDQITLAASIDQSALSRIIRECTASVDVTSAVPGSYPNATELIITPSHGRSEAEATLTVVDAPGFAKAFSPATIAQGGVSTLTFTINNAVNAINVEALAFNDNFPDGMIVAPDPDMQTSCTGGIISATAGGASTGYSGGGVAAGASCTVSVDVQALRAGTLENISGTLTSDDLPDDAPGARATLTVNEAPLSAAMAFTPSTIAQGGISTLSYTLSNGAAIAATEVLLTDTLPADMTLADVPDARTTCTGGTLTAAAGGSDVSWSGGTLAAGETCTVSVDVTSSVTGSYTNPTESLTSSLGPSTPAEATLSVNAAGAPGFARVFSPDTIQQGGETQIVFTVDNSANAIGMTGMAFDDSLPAGVSVADTPGIGNSCGGTFTPVAGATTLAFTGGVLAAGATCELRVTVRAIEAGTLSGPDVNLTSNLATATAAEAVLTVTAADAPGFAKVFSPATIDPGGVSTLTFTVNNAANAVNVGSLAFNDNFPDGMIVAPDPDMQTSCTGGTISAAAGGASVGYSGGGVTAGASCTISVDVQAAGLVGPLENISGTLTSDLPDDAPGARATLTVNEAPLSAAMAFTPSTIAQGGISTLSYTLSNGAAIAATEVSLADMLPTDMMLADVPDARTTCTGGTLTAAAGGSDVSWSGGTLAAGETCTVSVDVTAAVTGSYTNPTESLTSSLGTSTPATATLTVTAADALGFAKAFSPATIDPGRVSTLTFTVNNTANLIEVGSLAFTDNFPDGMAVAPDPDMQTSCTGGTISAAAGGASVGYSGGGVAAGQICTISVDVQALGLVGAQRNVSGMLTSDLPVSTPGAEATLTINEVPLLVTMAFDPPEIDPGGISKLTYTLENRTGFEGATPISLLDMLPADVVVADVPDARTTCAGGSLTTENPDPIETASIVYSGGSLAADSICTISVDVTSSVAGSYPNETESVTSALGTSTPATATLTVTEVPLSVSMAFTPSTIAQGGISTLNYTLSNGAAIAATEVSLADMLPADMTLADVPDARTTCTGGTLTAAAGGSDVSWSGGTLAAGETCTVSVDVTSSVTGSYTNPTESLTSSLGPSTPAEATLSVNAAGAPGFARVFSPDTIQQGGETQIVFTVDNSANAIGMTGMAFDDSLPAGVSVADTPGIGNSCGGTFTPVAGATTLAFTGGVLAAGATCELRVTVRAIEAGTLSGPDVNLTSNLATATAAEAVLTVTAADAPGFAKVFSPATIDPGGVSTLTFTVNNAANAVNVGSLAFNDNFPDGMIVAPDPDMQTSCTGGTISAAAGGASVGYSGGGVTAGASCTISVDVQAAGLVGPLENISGTLTSDLPDDAPGTRATLTVNEAPLSAAMAFTPSTIAQGGISTLSYTLSNGAAIAATEVSLADMLPTDMMLADVPDARTTCTGGTLTAAAGGSDVSWSGGTLAAGETCTVSVDVTAAVTGSYTNPTESLTSSLGTSTPATATLTVTEAPLSAAMAFTPSTIAQGGISTLSYTLSNGAAIAATEVSLADTLPAGVSVADTPGIGNSCGGTFTPGAGDTALTFTDGDLAAGETCTVSVDVTSSVTGSYTNPTESLTSSLGPSTPAEATLSVNAAGAPGFARVFSPDTIQQGGETQIVFTVDNSANAIGMTGMAFDDSLPAGVSVADTPSIGNSCGGTFTPVAGATTLAFTGGALAAGTTCELRVSVRAIEAGTLSGPDVNLTSNLATATAAEAVLTVTAADAPGFAKVFSPATIDPGGVSTLTFTINNAANAIEVEALAFNDNFPDGMIVAPDPDTQTSCTGGTISAAAGGASVGYSGGGVAAGQICTISVDVQAAGLVGAQRNVSGMLTSDLPDDAPGARATLTVNEAPLSAAMAFTPSTIAQGGISTLSYTLSNGAAIAATEVSLADMLPTDMMLADVPDARTTCTGGTLTAAAGGSDVSWSGGTLAAGETCTVSVDVTAAVTGSYTNPTESLTSSLGTSTPATATLTVTAADALGFAKAFSPATIDPGRVSTLTFTVNNTANLIEVGSLAFTDNFPDGMAVAPDPDMQTSCTGGTISAAAGGASVGYSGGGVATGQICTISVDVQALGLVGAQRNVSGMLTSDLPVSTPGAEATLTINEVPLLVTMAFDPPEIDPGGISKLTYTLENRTGFEGATPISLLDMLPADVVVADVPDARTTCAGGSLTTENPDPIETASIVYSGGSLAADSICTISVDVTSSVAGSYPNETESVTSALGTSTPATATLTVTEAPLSAAMAFTPSTIAQGGISTLSYTLSNGAAIAATEVSLADTLPAGVSVADTPGIGNSCGGTFTPGAGDTALTFTDGDLAAGETCTVSVDVTSSVTGSYTNPTESLTSSLGPSTPAEATLSVNAAGAPGFARVFSPDTIQQGGETQIVFTVDNSANAIGMTGMAFDDSLPAGVSVADTPSIGNSCGGTFTPVAGATTLAFTGGALAAGATCELRVSVRAIEAGTLSGPDVNLTSNLATATAAEAVLTVTAADAPGFAKVFSPATIDPGGVSTLTFTINNAANAIEVEALAFNDNFPDGMIVAPDPDTQTSCTGGTISAAAGGASVGYSGGGVAAGQICTISVDVQALGLVGAQRNVSGMLTSDLPDDAPGARATLTVNEAPLSAAMAFTPSTIAQGGISTLSYTLSNGAAIAATEVSLADMLPTDMMLADVPDARTTCTGGTLTAAAGGSDVSWSGGTLAAGETCTVSVDVTAAVTGSYTNPTESLTSSLGTSTPATATLTVTAADALGFAKAFSPATIDPGRVSTLTFTVNNTANLIEVGSLAFTDNFPDGMAVAPDPDMQTSCTGGTISAAAGGASVGYSGGGVATGQICTISVDVQALGLVGAQRNVSGMLTSDLPVSTPGAEATLTINEVPLLVTMAFDPPEIDPGGISKLTYTLENRTGFEGATPISLLDMLPADVVVADVPDARTTCAGGSLTTENPDPIETASIVYSGGSLAADSICTISVDVTSSVAGSYPNETESVTSALGTSTPATATLTVTEVPLSVSMAFTPSTIAQGGISTLNYTLSNGAAIAATEVSLADMLPADMTLADVPDARTTCTGGTLTAAAGGSDVSWSGGTLAAGETCTVSVDVTSSVTGSYTNPTESLTSSLGTSTPATATLSVNAAGAPGFARVFSPDTIQQGGETQIVFTVDNSANAIGMTGMAFDDSLPAGVSVADTPSIGNSCGGTFTPVAGATTLAFTGGALAAGATCELRVSVRAIEAGTLSGPDVNLTSNLATATAAEAVLTVTAADAPGFAKVFSPATIDPGGVSTLTFTVNNAANAVNVGSLAFNDNFPDGMIVAPDPDTQTSCTGGTISAAAGGASVGYSGGGVAAGQICTISVDVQALGLVGAQRNVSGMLTSDLPDDAPGARATLTVNEAPLSAAMAFTPSTIAQGGISTLSYTLSNGAAIAATEVSLADMLPTDMMLADVPDARTTCTGGTLTAAAGGSDVSWSGGTLAAGETCTVSVDVTAAVTGSYTNPTESLTSSLGTSTPATATLTVTAADALGFAKAFSPATIDPGRVSTLTFTVNNTANLIEVGSLAFTDNFPDGMAVAPDPDMQTSCTGGTISAAAGGASVGYSGGGVATGQICTISVDVQALGLVGAQRNVSGMLTSDLPVSTPGAEATLTINEVPLLVTMAFDPPEIDPGGISKLTYTLENRTGFEGATPISLLDMLPADVVVADVPDARTTCAGGSLTTENPDPIETASIVYSGGSLAADSICTISVDVTSSVAGSYPNETESVTSALGTSTPATATLTVTEAPLSAAMAFTPSTIAQGGISTLSYTLSNGAAIAATEVSLADTLPAGVSVADTPGIGNSCGGTFTPGAGDTALTFTDGDLAAGETCTVSVDVTSSVTGSYTNPTESLTSSLGPSTPAEATLSVNAAGAPGFARVFSPDTIQQGGETQIVFTVDNSANAIGMTGMAFDDSLPAGVSVADTPSIGNSCGGTFTPVAGATTLAFTGGALAAGATCELRVSVRAIEAGTLSGPDVNLTSNLATATAAEAVLTVTAADAPGFAKVFSPATIDPGGVSTLTFTINNAANAIEVEALAFNDNFPDGMIVAPDPDTQTSCTGGTISAAAGGASVGYSGGGVAAGQICTISVDVQALGLVGAQRNVSGMLTSDLPDDAPGARATLTVNEAPLSAAMAFTPSTIAQGGISTLSYTLSNGAAIAATEVSLADMLPTDMMLADVPDARTTCTGGTLTAAAGGSDVSWSGGTLAAGETCTVSVDVTAAVTGSYTNPTESLTSSLGTSTPATATLTVTAADALGFAKAFSPATIDPGRVSTLTFTVNNTANLIEVGSLAFTDNFPDGMAVAPDPDMQTSCTGGTISAAAGGASVGYSGGGVATGQICTISVDVQALGLVGAQRNVSGMLTSDLPVSTPGAEATLTINEVPLLVTMAFDPPEIDPGGISKLTYTLENRTGFEGATPISLLDMLPADVVVADVPDARTTCAGGSLTTENPDPIETASIVYSGGSLAADSICTISVDVTSSVAGSYPNETESVTSALGTSTPATATLTVTEAPLSAAMAFTPSTIAQGGISTLSYTLSNGAAIAATEVSLADTLPAGVSVADTPGIGNSCGGTFTPGAGDTALTFTDGDLAAGETCTVSVDVTSSVTGSYTNPTESLTSSLGPSTPAEATLSVNAAGAPGFARVFSPDTIQQGGETQIVFTVDNSANAIGMTGMAFDDSLPAGVSVADTPSIGNSCGGTFTPVAGATTLAFTGGALAAGATCELRVSVRAIEAGTLSGPDVNLTSNLATATAAEAVLTVTAADAPGFAKVFSPATIDPGGVSTLTFTINNAANAIEVEALAFNDNFPDGMIVAPDPDTQTSCTGGTISAAAGGASVGYSGGGVAAGQICTISVDVQAAGLVGPLENISGTLTSDLPDDAPGARATLTVNEAPLSAAMAFTPSTIAQGGISTLSYTLSNGAAIAATEVSLADTLPAGVSVADTPGIGNSCGGTFTPGAGDTALTFTDGDLAAGETCTVSVDVTSSVTGSYTNPTESLTSSLGPSTPAEATLSVNAAGAPGFARVFSPDTIQQGGETQIVFTVDNSANAIGMTGMAFDDSLPAGVSVADTPSIGNSCGGTFTPVAGATTLAFTGGALAAGTTCELRVSVRAIEAGTLSGPDVNLTSNLATATAAEAVLTVTAADAPGFAKVFSPATIDPGGVSTLTFTINNAANAIEVEALAFNDNFPDGMIVAPDPDTQTSCTGGTISAAAGGASVGYSGGGVAAGQICTISVDVQAAGLVGAQRNVSGMLTSDLPDDAPGARATLTVNEAPLSAAMAFTPSTIAQGGISTLSYTLSNGAAIAATEVSLADMLPTDMMLADVPDARTTCTGGTLTAAAGGSDVSWSGGTLAAGETCTVSVDVTAAVTGSYTNPTESLTSSLGTSTPATATLTVTEAPLSAAMAFTPSTIAQGGISTLSYTLSNGAAIAATEVSLADTLPAGVSVADTPGIGNSCGGTFTPGAGDTALTFTDGDLAAGETCTVSVDVTSSVTGSYTNPTESLTSSLGPSTPAEATLSVNAAGAPGFARVFSPDTIQQGGETQIVFTVDNSANAIGMTGMAFDDSLPAGVSVADTPSIGNSCGGTFTPVAGATTLAFTGGALAAGATCELRVSVRAIEAGTLSGPDVNLTSNLATATAAEAVLTVTAADAPGFAKVFSPATIDPGGVSTLTFTINNAANAIEVEALAFNDNFPDGMIVAPDPDTQTSCTGGTISAAAGGASVGYSGGGVAAGQICTISVDVQALGLVGAQRNVSGMLTSDLPDDAPGARATLTVNEAPLSAAMAFTPSTIAQGGISTLNYTLSNGATIAATEVSLADMLPADMTLADVPDARTTCTGGTLSAAAGSSDVSWSGGTLAAGETCTVSVDVTSSVTGSYTNPTESLTSSLGPSTPAEATLSVNAADAPGTSATPLSFTKSFRTSPVSAGGSQTITFAIVGTGVDNFFDIAFTDNLSGFLGGVIPTVTSLPSSGFCGSGSIASTSVSAGELILSVRGAMLTGNSSCTFDVEFTIPADLPPGDYTNTTSGLSALQGSVESHPVNSPPASDTMTVSGPTADLAVIVTDAIDPIVPGTNQVYTVQVTNNGPWDAPSVVGTFTLPAGTTFVSTSGCAEDPDGVPTCALGGIAASDSADYTVTATIDTSTTGTITASATAVSTTTGPTVVDDNSANDTGSEDTEVTPVADISVTKDDGLTNVDAGGTVTYDIVVSNNGPSADPAVLLTDTFPDELTCTYTSVAAGGASGNTATGADDLSETLALPVGGEVVYTATCTVDGSASGTLSNTATVDGSLTDPDNDNDSATDGDTVVNPPVAPGFAKAFSPATIDPGGVSTLTFTINNAANAINVEALAFNDNFPDGMIVAPDPDTQTSCTGGTISAAAGGASVGYSGGGVTAGASCTVSVDVQAAGLVGPLENISGTLTSDLPDDAPGARATLTVNEAPLSAAMAFTPTTIAQGSISTLSYTLSNGAAIAATEVSLADTLPADMMLADVPDARTTCTGGTLSAAAGGNTIAFADGDLAAGETCTVSVDVTSSVTGSYTNPTESLTSSLGTSTPAEATLSVNAAGAPGFAKAFSPATIDPGGVSTLTFTINNAANAVNVEALAFNDNFPDGMIVAPDPDTQTSCTGGTISAAAGGASVGYSGGGVTAGASCTISVDVQAVGLVGPLENISGTLTSDLPDDAPGARATLTVNEAPLSAAMAFEPTTIAQGGISTLSYTLSNGAAIAATEVSLADTLPADVVVAAVPSAQTSCGGTFNPGAGDTALTFTDGDLAAGETCTVSVDVTSSVTGSYTNPTESLTSSLGTSTPATATLSVNAADALGFAKAFSPATIDPGGVSTLTFTINNAANAINVEALAFNDNFPDGMIVAPDPDTQTSCTGGTISAAAGGASVGYSGGGVTAGASCTISVNVQAAGLVGPLENISGELTSDLPDDAPGARATLTVNEAPLSAAMAFTPTTIAQGGISTLSYTLSNGAAITATEVSLADMLPTDMTLADVPDARTTCTGGTLSAAAGGSDVSWSGGTLAAGETCTVSVDVTSSVAGSYTNPTESLTSSLGTSTPAEATLSVNAAGAPGFAKAFSPATIDPGGVSTLTFTINNAANAVNVEALAFNDNFPDGMIVAPDPDTQTSCTGGTISAAAGGASVGYSGGGVTAGASCTISVDVQAVGLVGPLENISGTLTSDLPDDAPGARATLTVNEAPLSAAMAFEPTTIAQGGISTLSYTLSNGAAIAATEVSLADTLPADVVVAAVPSAQTSCGGTFNPGAGDTALTFTDGDLAAGETCTVSVDVTSSVTGSYTNPTESLTSSLGTSTPATATLSVNAADALGFAVSRR